MDQIECHQARDEVAQQLVVYACHEQQENIKLHEFLKE